jgi:aspartyl-tRNA(Asn)/glutamyl-tRNA(Gln) amidotransferase subunit C
MSVDTKEIEELALLARLHLEPDEVAQLQQDLGAVLDHFKQLESVDTTGVAPMTHPIALELRLRADAVAASLPVSDALRGAAKRDGDLFVVPSIIPGGES